MESYVLVSTRASCAPDVAKQAKSLEHVDAVEIVLGSLHDLVIGVRTESYADLEKVAARINSIAGVSSIVTCEGLLGRRYTEGRL